MRLDFGRIDNMFSAIQKGYEFMIKRTFNILLCLSLTAIFILCPISVSADESVLKDNITWKTEGSVLYLDGIGDMVLNYNFLSQIPWYDMRNNIDTVVIGEGITTIADGAFTDFSNLINIALPSTMTVIGPSAFMTCTALEHITLTNRITRIESGAFVGCESLKSITVPEVFTTSVVMHFTIVLI